ncbi:MAG: Spy/CpxP family protein refolding chaperone [Desulfuromonadaceae bacterium]|nr:Spy/CpxP family protein refolding chaperone [Geobacteraceae bacterium]
MKKIGVLSISILTIFLLSTSAMAWSSGKTRQANARCSEAQQGNRMAVILDLSAEQQQKMDELRTTQQQERARMRTELKEAREQLRAAQPGNGIDTKDLKTRASAYADLKAAMLVNKIEHKQQMFSILTPEQQEKAAELKAMHSAYGQKGQSYKGNCYTTGSDCCPKSFHQNRGYNVECRGLNMDCGKQRPCTMSRCR